jgi:uncharacterized protein involved in exopolysaccharide biosynthesis
MTTQDGSSDSQQVGLLAAMWRYRWLVLAFLFLGGVLATFVTLSANDASRAKATVALTDPRGNSIFRQGSSANLDLTRYTAERAAFAESVAVLGRAAEILDDGSTSSSLDEMVEVEPRPDTSILVINAEAADSDAAVATADAAATAYQELSLAETRQKTDLALAGLDVQRQEVLTVINDPASTSAEVAAGTQTLSTVNARAAEIESAAELFGDGVEFADPARIEPSGGKLELLRSAAAGAMIGLVLGAALSWVLADRSQRVGRRPQLVVGVVGAEEGASVERATDLASAEEQQPLGVQLSSVPRPDPISRSDPERQVPSQDGASPGTSPAERPTVPRPPFQPPPTTWASAPEPEPGWKRLG